MTALLLAAALAADPTTAPAERVAGDLTLRGTIDLPATPGPWPVVLLHPGSGPTDRDGNQLAMKNDSLKLLGRALADRGIACLRIDKRGIGGSGKPGGKEADLRFDAFTADAAGWLKWLRADGRFGRVGFVGHSEGSLVGSVAAQAEPVDAFVSLCGPGQKVADVLRVQFKKNLPADLLGPGEAILVSLEAGKTVADVPATLAPVFRPAIQPYLISLFKYDPVAELGKVAGPVLVVSGERDAQVPPAEGDRLAAAAKGAKRLTLPAMSHVLKETDRTAVADQFKTVYSDPELPLHPRLAGELADFLLPHLRPAK